MTSSAERRSLVQAVQLTRPQESFIRTGHDDSSIEIGLPHEERGDRIDGGDGLDNLLVPITTKLRRRTYHALRRAYLQQKLRHRTPATQQEIVESAVGEWLTRNGFSDD